MNESDVKSYLHQLERDNAYELNIVLEINPSYLSLEYLRELRSQWELQDEFVDKIFHRFFVLGGTSPIWLFFGFLINWFTDNYWLNKIIYLFPLSLVVFIGGMTFLAIRYGGKRQHKEIGRIIYEELERRRMGHNHVRIS